MSWIVGPLTRRLRTQFLNHKVSVGALEPHVRSDPSTLSFTASLEGTLFFWQLGSVLSADALHRLITAFYTRVFDDTEAPWFRSVFAELGSKEHHIERQHLFWMDVFFGHSRYKGGENGVHFHHKLAQDIMTSNGAKRWMMHMNAAIAQSELNAVDPRIELCLREFLEFTMETYGVQFDFNVVDWIHTVASKL